VPSVLARFGAHPIYYIATKGTFRVRTEGKNGESPNLGGLNTLEGLEGNLCGDVRF
jgi:hypothetical protein